MLRLLVGLPLKACQAVRRLCLRVTLKPRIVLLAWKTKPENSIVLGYVVAPLLVEAYGVEHVIDCCAQALMTGKASDIDLGVGYWLKTHVEIVAKVEA